MKKLLLIVIGLGMFISNANASCATWEATGGTAPGEYCWEISFISGHAYYKDDIVGGREKLIDREETSLIWFATVKEAMADGKFHYGIYIDYDVYGIPNRPPIWVMYDNPTNGSSGVLVAQKSIDSPSGNIVNGTRYRYFIPYKLVENNDTYNDVNIKGDIVFYGPGFEIKDRIKVH